MALNRYDYMRFSVRFRLTYRSLISGEEIFCIRTVSADFRKKQGFQGEVKLKKTKKIFLSKRKLFDSAQWFTAVIFFVMGAMVHMNAIFSTKDICVLTFCGKIECKI